MSVEDIDKAVADGRLKSTLIYGERKWVKYYMGR
jgi:hypothetical protein